MDKQTESRSQFEAWMSDNWNHPRAIEKTGDAYILTTTRTQWEAWTASRESLVVEIASHTEFEIEHMISPEKEGYSLDWIDGRNYAARQVEAIGIRIKGGEV